MFGLVFVDFGLIWWSLFWGLVWISKLGGLGRFQHGQMNKTGRKRISKESYGRQFYWNKHHSLIKQTSLCFITISVSTHPPTQSDQTSLRVRFTAWATLSASFSTNSSHLFHNISTVLIFGIHCIETFSPSSACNAVRAGEKVQFGCCLQWQ